MSDETKSSPLSVHLNVLPHSGKVEQLRSEFASAKPSSTSSTPPKDHPDQTLIDRALDPNASPQQKLLREKVIEVLRQIYDPELPVNIYELGLIYDIDVAADNSVHVKMTLTAPACPVAESLPPEVERRIEMIDEVPRAKVELVWDPPWSKERMSEAALLELGLL
jgi:FeS assembly SUF system protein